MKKGLSTPKENLAKNAPAGLAAIAFPTNAATEFTHYRKLFFRWSTCLNDPISHQSRPRGRLNKAMENSPGANAIEVLSLTRRFSSLVAVDHLTLSCATRATL